MKELIQVAENYYNERQDERDRLMVALNIPDTHPLLKNTNDCINEVAQLRMALELGIELTPDEISEIRERLACVMLGFKHKKRRDSETPELY